MHARQLSIFSCNLTNEFRLIEAGFDVLLDNNLGKPLGRINVVMMFALNIGAGKSTST